MSNIITTNVAKLVTPCRRVDIVRAFQAPNPPNDSFDNGYKTFVKIDGHHRPNCYEREITLLIEAGSKVQVEVLWKHGLVEVFEPEEFEFSMGCLEIRTHPNRYPCQIIVGGYEPRCYSVAIRFAEGECPWVDLRFHLRPAKEATPVTQGPLELDNADEPIITTLRRKE
jgi:hypothetical protein